MKNVILVLEAVRDGFLWAEALTGASGELQGKATALVNAISEFVDAAQEPDEATDEN